LSCTGELDYNNASDLVLEIDKDQMRLRTFARDGSIDPHNSFITAYSATYPKMILHSTDNKKLCFEMNDGEGDHGENDPAYSRKLMVNCLNQQNRDLIVMCIRIFGLKNSLKLDRALEFYLDDINKCKTDVYIELESTVKELYSLQEENTELRNRSLQQKNEIKNLYKQIEAYKTHTSNIETHKPEPEDYIKLKNRLSKVTESKCKVKEKYEQAKISIIELRENIKELIEKTNNQSKDKISNENIEGLGSECKKLKENLEFANQELEIAQAKDKTSIGKIKRQKEAIDLLTKQNEELKQKLDSFQEQGQNYMLLVSENKELLRKLARSSEILNQKDKEIKEFNGKLEEIVLRHEKSNKSLVMEITRLSDEVENCKKCERLESSGISIKKKRFIIEINVIRCLRN
jgi:chromosome segregation ATPase